MTRFYKMALITSIAFLVSCDGKDSIKPLDDIYGEWFYSKKEGDVLTSIGIKLYLDSDTTEVLYGTRYTKPMNKEEAAEFMKHEQNYGTSEPRLKKELSADHLSFYKEINGQREIKLKFKILESNEKSMTVEVLEASEDTKVQSLLGQTLIFQINRKRNKQPIYKSDGSNKKKTYFFHGGPEF